MIMYLADRHYDLCSRLWYQQPSKQQEVDAYGCSGAQKKNFSVAKLGKTEVLGVSTNDIYLISHLIDQLFQRYRARNLDVLLPTIERALQRAEKDTKDIEAVHDVSPIPVLIIFISEEYLNGGFLSLFAGNLREDFRKKHEKVLKMKEKIGFPPVIFVKRTARNIANIMKYSDSAIKNLPGTLHHFKERRMEGIIANDYSDPFPVVTEVPVFDPPPYEEREQESEENRKRRIDEYLEETKPCTKVILLDADNSGNVEDFEPTMYGPKYPVASTNQAVGLSEGFRGNGQTRNASTPAAPRNAIIPAAPRNFTPSAPRYASTPAAPRYASTPGQAMQNPNWRMPTMPTTPPILGTPKTSQRYI